MLRRRQEALVDRVRHEAQQVVVVAVDVEQADRLVVVAELAPGPDLVQLLQRADAAGQGDEGVGALGHHLLAHVHGRHHVQFVQAGVADLALHQAFGDDADHAAAGGQRGVGHLAHQADLAAAVDQLPAARADGLAERARRRGVGRPRAVARAAVDADAEGSRRVIGRAAWLRGGGSQVTSRVPQTASCQYWRSRVQPRQRGVGQHAGHHWRAKAGSAPCRPASSSAASAGSEPQPSQQVAAQRAQARHRLAVARDAAGCARSAWPASGRCATRTRRNRRRARRTGRRLQPVHADQRVALLR